jgi:hypothetical protein
MSERETSSSSSSSRSSRSIGGGGVGIWSSSKVTSHSAHKIKPKTY